MPNEIIEELIVAGEKLWLYRDSNPGPFADLENTLPLSNRATRSSHQQFLTQTYPVYIIVIPIRV